jgi:O-acetylhomoserine (thiol)-lyase
MDQNTPLPLVAPDMGLFEDGIKSFQGIKPPYARGGGTSATQILERACQAHLGNHRNTDPLSVAIVSSGQAANHVVFKAIHGGDLVSSSHLFGTTKVDLKKTFERTGGKIAWVDPGDTQAFIDNTTLATTTWFLEAISNPAGRVPDFESLSHAARERGIMLAVDATLAAGMPYFDGLKYADVLTISLTKQAGGGQNLHTGGAILVGNNFAWEDKAARFPEFKEYFSDAAGTVVLPSSPFGALASKISLHEGSGVIAPQSALSIARSLPGMGDRVANMCENARMLAEILDGHEKVNSVQLAGYKTNDVNDACTQKYLGKNHFVILVDLKDGFAAAASFINAQQFAHAVALGQQNTAISHPASSTHRQYSKDELAKMGIYPGTIRISVGCEAPRTLARKLRRALTF